MDASQHRFAAGIPPPNPRGGGAAPGHRRAQSETFLRFPDDTLFDSDDFGISDIDFPSLSDENGSAASASGGAPPPAPMARGPGAHGRSQSVDAAFFDALGFQGLGGGGGQEKQPHHRYSSSMDGSEGESALSSDYAKKAMAADKLAELSLIDPKRAKRILANRQSAARSKERKIRYTGELERKVQTLQTEATTLSAQVTLLQRDTSGLTAENRELKVRLQAMEQQAHLREALNEALREEVQRLKLATGQLPNFNGNAFSRGIQQSFFPQNQQMPTMSGHQGQQLQSSQSRSSSSGPSMTDQPLHDSMDFI